MEDTASGLNIGMVVEADSIEDIIGCVGRSRELTACVELANKSDTKDVLEDCEADIEDAVGIGSKLRGLLAANVMEDSA